MELCTAQSIPTLSKLITANPSRLRSFHQIASFRRHSRSVGFTKLVTRASMSEESSIGGKPFFPTDVASVSEEPSVGGKPFFPTEVAVVEEPPAVENKSVYDGNGPTELPKEESPKEEAASVDGEEKDFLANLKLDSLDSDNTYSYLLYGGGALVFVWLASAVVSAVDSIPLFSKLMEVVGLGYATWFTIRFVLFKKNRDEFAAKFEELKQQVIGSDDD